MCYRTILETEEVSEIEVNTEINERKDLITFVPIILSRRPETTIPIISIKLLLCKNTFIIFNIGEAIGLIFILVELKINTARKCTLVQE